MEGCWLAVTETKWVGVRLLALCIFGTATVGPTAAQTVFAGIKTSAGALFVWNWPDGAATVEVTGERIEQPGKELIVWVDDFIVQFSTVTLTELCEEVTCSETTPLLTIFTEWELAHWRSALGVTTLEEEAQQQITLSGRDWLRWSLLMPESSGNVKKQFFLSTLVREHVVNLGTPFWQAEEEPSWQFLTSVASTMVDFDEPLDLTALQDSIRGSTSVTAVSWGQVKARSDELLSAFPHPRYSPESRLSRRP